MWVIAHRGASQQAPENTLSAFSLALQQGAHGIELDTYQLEDQQVVIHDRFLHRTTNGQGKVTEASVAYLRSLDAGDGKPVPLLSEVMQLLPDNIICNVEIKHLTDAKAWLASLDAAMQHSALRPENLIVSSFNHTWLQDIKVLRPDIQIGALTASYPVNGADFASLLDAYAMHIDMDIVDEDIVRLAHREGLKVLVYTVDDPQDMHKLKSWGVDGIFTNLPELALQEVGA
ncbi:glycerophosphodiester phosphodiesterase [Salinimonas lutimaris]|uniref:glycerophosphodiester phosphodiesterase n=1 Tax=Salinimonas lutimaris TaxID=914153 RepID=UPI0010BF9BE2|nr:glycerophosphodiester phosphodiesterase family protein [Salinimonas lutimaris]